MKLKKGDTVKITVGKDKGREGKIEKTYKKQNSVVITGVNIYKKHVKKSEQLPQGGVVELPRALNASKVAIVCKKCKRTARIGYKIESNKKIRICRRCKEKL